MEQSITTWDAVWDTAISGGSSATRFVPLYSPLAERQQVSIQILDKLESEGGRIELRRVSPRLTAYKAVSAPNGLRLPYENTGRLRRPVSFSLFAGFRAEAECLQPIVSSVDHAAIF